jgi:rhodanese-related sulfurtransferase
MNWIIPIIIVAAFAGLYLLKNRSLIDAPSAGECIRNGCKIIDVRSSEEFQRDALPGTVNIPLNRLRDEVPRQFPDKTTVLLLHCLSGTRSGMGVSMLKSLGYEHVHNLGSHSRAKAVLSAK